MKELVNGEVPEAPEINEMIKEKRKKIVETNLAKGVVKNMKKQKCKN